MSDITELPTAEKGSVTRKPGRPKSSDPKVSVTLSLRRSTRDRIATRVPDGQTVAGVLSAAVEHKYGVPVEERRAAQVVSRLKAKK